jgi:TPR repeat protein
VKNRKRQAIGYLCVGIVSLFLSGHSQAADFEKGYTAFGYGNFVAALQEWEPLAAQGHPRAQYSLGVMHRHGYGVDQDDGAAVKWFKLAAAQEYADAQFQLADMYRLGHGVPQDNKIAAQWYQRASALGHVDAQFMLGLFHALGTGVPQDFISSRMWLEVAKSQGLAAARGAITEFSSLMTPSQIQIAQDKAQACIKAQYKGCRIQAD